MTEKDIRYEHIQVRDLEKFAENIIQKSQHGQFVPITMQRARAHAHNPYADPDDVALLVAVDGNGEVVGYFGILPVMLRVGDQLHKCHWFTTWSVSEKVRGQGVGSDLMREALTLEKDFLIVGSVHARRVCRKFGFWERDPLEYFWIDPSGMGTVNPLTWLLRLVRKILHLLKINSEVRTTNCATRAIDRILSPLTRQFFYPLLTRNFAKVLQEIQFQQVDEIRQDLPQGTKRAAVELLRGIKVVNWMLTYPWVVKTGSSPTEGKDYYFSDARSRHEFIAIELLEGEKKTETKTYAGFVLFQISQKENGITLKTLDYAVRDPRQYKQILALAIHLGQENDAVTIEVPEEVARPLKGTILGRLLLQKKNRIYQCHPSSENSPLAQAWKDITLHLCDGDMAFS